MPGNPWPHDMSITIEDRSQPLLEMLWLREAYDLDASGDVPPPLVDTPAPASTTVTPEERTQWAGAWPRLWASVVRHAGAEHDRQLLRQLIEGPLAPTERAGLLERLMGPSWRTEFSSDAFADTSYREWEQRGAEAHMASRPRRLEDSPERRDLEALIPAWRSGLTKIVTIPTRGTFTRALGPTSLLVTEDTRSDSESYRQALAWFANRQ